MTAEELRSLRLAVPFRPFELVLDNGRRLRIEQPPYLAISPLGNQILVATGGENVDLLKPEWVKEAVFLPPGNKGTADSEAKRSRDSAP